MSKRTVRRISSAHDFVETPEEAVLPLVPQLEHGAWFYEPCAGNGALAHALTRHGMVTCCGMSDIKPDGPGIPQRDALTLDTATVNGAQYLITNPPWRVELLHPIIDHLTTMRPTWLLLYSDWLFTRQAAKYHNRIFRIVTMPRVKWIAGTRTSGFENCCWIMFSAGEVPTPFIRSGWT